MSGKPESQSELGRQELLLAHTRAGGDRGALGACLLRLGELYGEREDTAKARPAFEEAAGLLRELDDRAGLARCWYGLGILEAQAGDPEASSRWMEQAVLAYRTAGDHRGEALSHACLGETWAFAGEPEKALPQYEQALSFFRQLDDEGQVASVLMSLGELHADGGDDDKAKQRFAEALPLIHRMGDKLGQAVCLLYLGETELRTRAVRRAVDHLDKAATQLREQRVVDLVPRALHQGGLAHALEGDRMGAESRYREAIILFEARGSQDEARRVEDDLRLLTPPQ